jgi:hypothetical protein
VCAYERGYKSVGVGVRRAMGRALRLGSRSALGRCKGCNVPRKTASADLETAGRGAKRRGWEGEGYQYVKAYHIYLLAQFLFNSMQYSASCSQTDSEIWLRRGPFAHRASCLSQRPQKLEHTDHHMQHQQDEGKQAQDRRRGLKHWREGRGRTEERHKITAQAPTIRKSSVLLGEI